MQVVTFPKTKIHYRGFAKGFAKFFRIAILKNACGRWLLPAGNYIFKDNNKNTGTRFEICSNLTIKISE